MNENDKHTTPIHPGEILRSEFLFPVVLLGEGSAS